MFAGVSGDRLALASNAIQQRPIGITGPMPQVGAQEPIPVSSRQVGSRVVQLRQILDDPATAQSSQSASTPQVQYENRFARLVHSTKQMPEVEVLWWIPASCIRRVSPATSLTNCWRRDAVRDGSVASAESLRPGSSDSVSTNDPLSDSPKATGGIVGRPAS